MAVEYDGNHKVVAIESRGFLFGAAMCQHSGSPLVLARKKGKLPYATTQVEYELEYGTATLEMHIDAVQPGERCVIVDDLLATGGTAAAAAELVRRQGGTVVGTLFLVELGFLDGRRRLHPSPVTSLVQI
jgi:adenine phosphoribosyltransferase